MQYGTEQRAWQPRVFKTSVNTSLLPRNRNGAQRWLPKASQKLLYQSTKKNASHISSVINPSSSSRSVNPDNNYEKWEYGGKNFHKSSSLFTRPRFKPPPPL